MSVEIILFCSLIFYTPYYDCDETWMIHWHPDQMMDRLPSGGWQSAWAELDTNTIHIGNLKTDKCSNSLLWHELNHLMRNDSSHKWYKDYSACTNFPNGDPFG